MTTSTSSSDQVKFVSKIPPQVHRQLKIAAAINGLDIQDAVDKAFQAWLEHGPFGEAPTSGAAPFGTTLPPATEQQVKSVCKQRGISMIQALTQAVTGWVDKASQLPKPKFVRRFIVCNQKGGVGKTALTAALAQALAEAGLRVLMIDYDPQGHLTVQLRQARLLVGADSLSQHMVGKPLGALSDIVVQIEGERFGDRLFLLPVSNDAFLLDPQLTTVRARERALEKALEPLEGDYDVIIIDCPPSLGLSVDAALQYGSRRTEEPEKSSGILIPVEAEDSSAEAYAMLTEQIEDLRSDLGIDIDVLGLVIGRYSVQKGIVATSSREMWESLGDPPVLGVMKDLKEQREAARFKLPLFEHAPDCELANVARRIAGALS